MDGKSTHASVGTQTAYSRRKADADQVALATHKGRLWKAAFEPAALAIAGYERQLAAQRVRYVLWSPLDLPRFPAFEQFLSERYRPVWRFTDEYEIWELK